MKWTKRHNDLLLGILAIDILWKLSEIELYGQTIPSPEDTIAAIAWIVFVVAAYRAGRNDERGNKQP